MSKGKKAFITILIDAFLFTVLIYSVYAMLFKADSELMKNICTAIVVISIPAMFFVTYLSFAGDKYDYREDSFEEGFEGDTLSEECLENKNPNHKEENE